MRQHGALHPVSSAGVSLFERKIDALSSDLTQHKEYIYSRKSKLILAICLVGSSWLFSGHGVRPYLKEAALCHISASRFRVSGSGVRVPDFDFQGQGFGVRVSSCLLGGPQVRVSGFGLELSCFVFRVWGLRSGGSGCIFRASGLGF